MDDHNSPEAVEARANQEDPIIMYLVVRESLGMSIGKTAAQAAHSSQMMLLKYQAIEQAFDYVAASNGDSPIRDMFHKICDFKAWLNTSFRKVVLRADDKEWEKLKAAIPDTYRVTVVDAGLTEIAAGSETVIAVWPIHKSEVPKVIKKLQVLK